MSFDFALSSVSVKTLAQVVSWDGILTPGPKRGGNIVKPSMRGQAYAPKELDAYDFSVPLILLGTSQANFQDGLSSLKALTVARGNPIPVGRTLPRTGGDLSTSAFGEARVSEVGMVNGLLTGKLVLEVTNLDGCWYGAGVSPTIPATLTVAGDLPTSKMTLVLPGAGTLTNTTLGVSVTVTAGQTLTVLGRTTSGSLSTVTAAGDPFGNWFTLAPGSNVITWSGSGTPTITYYPAYQ